MSNVYILEPPTSGKVLLKTTVGDIDIELWGKETPKACRNFIQLCLEGYYDNTTFHRVVKGFIVQGGDPNGDGTGGESIYGEPFKDEFHQRLRFARRGLVAMANAGKDDNGSQFFFTLGATPELQDKHTLFGKITGNTIYNMLKLEEGLVRDEKPVYPHRIIKAEVLHNPFTDIEPRVTRPTSKRKERKKKEKKPGVKNFKLLSFGAEAEEDEEESARESVKFSKKGKSTHDVLNDPKLSSETQIVEEAISENSDKGDDNEENSDSSNEEEEEVNDEEDHTLQLDKIREKLSKKDGKKKTQIFPEDDNLEADKLEENVENPEETDKERQLQKIREKLKRAAKKPDTSEASEVYESYLEEERLEKKKKKYDAIQKEIDSVKREYHQNKLKKVEEKKEEVKEKEKSETILEYRNEYDKYKSKKALLPKKGSDREQFTLQLLEKFKKKITSIKEGTEEENEEDESKKPGKDDEEAWLRHRLQFQEKTPVLAKDANKKDDDWFEIYDPRSSLNKRRRGEDTIKFKK